MANKNYIEYLDTRNTKTLKDFKGNKDTQRQIEEIVLQMDNANLFRVYGISSDMSFLLHGLPGTGKTHAIDCIHGELLNKKNKMFAKLNYDIGTYGTPYINMGSKNLQSFFDIGYEMLSKTNNITGVMYVFDECDVLMGKRGGLHSHKEDDKLLETLMTNMQKIHDNGSTEYLFFMTNFIENIDDASMRSRRIDMQIKFELPDYEGRYGLLEYEINKSNELAKYKIIRQYNIDELAKLSDGFNCADISDIPRKALRTRILEVAKERTDKLIPAIYIQQDKLITSVKSIKEMKNKQNIIGFN